MFAITSGRVAEYLGRTIGNGTIGFGSGKVGKKEQKSKEYALVECKFYWNMPQVHLEKYSEKVGQNHILSVATLFLLIYTTEAAEVHATKSNKYEVKKIGKDEGYNKELTLEHEVKCILNMYTLLL
ncbi:hypothetical protein Tco_1346596 [Tanacetum coccineum]